jgi:putative alpha-1,2-mannosidase
MAASCLAWSGLRSQAEALSVEALSPVPFDKVSQFVQPRIGTGGHGHCYPGATVPFGMVQLSPDTESITLNDASYDRIWFRHEDLAAGGRFVLKMSNKPNPDFGSAPDLAPPSMSS